MAAGLLYSPAKLKRPLFYSNKKFCYNIFIRKRNFLNLKERGDCMFDDNGFSYQFAEFLRKAGDVNLSYQLKRTGGDLFAFLYSQKINYLFVYFTINLY